MVAPEVFVLDDIDGHAHAVGGQLPDELHSRVSEAAHSCPEQAIFIETESAQNGAVR
jgi:ferredoxin